MSNLDRKAPRRNLRLLLLYLVYVGIVFVFGVKLWQVTGRTHFSENDIATAEQEILGRFPPILMPTNAIPNGVLLFNFVTNCVDVKDNSTNADFAFQFRNVSKKDVVIQNIETSCGCTVVKIARLPLILAPQEKAGFTVTMRLSGVVGSSAKDVYMFTDQGIRNLQVIARITPSQPDSFRK
jgi:hypothetical protein